MAPTSALPFVTILLLFTVFHCTQSASITIGSFNPTSGLTQMGSNTFFFRNKVQMEPNEIRSVLYKPNGELSQLLINTMGFPSLAPFSNHLAYDVSRDRIWARSSRYAFTINYVTKSIDISKVIDLKQGGFIPKEGMAYDPSDDSLWVACGSDSFEQGLCKYDCKNGDVIRAFDMADDFGPYTFCSKAGCNWHQGKNISAVGVSGPYVYVGLRNGQIWRFFRPSMTGKTMIQDVVAGADPEEAENAVSGITLDEGNILTEGCYLWQLRDDSQAKDIRSLRLECGYNLPPTCSRTTYTLGNTLTPADGHWVQVYIYPKDVNGDSVSFIRATDIRQSDNKSPMFPDGQIYHDSVFGGAYAHIRAIYTDVFYGRTYTISYTTHDPFGAACSGTIQICIPAAGYTTCNGVNTDTSSLY